MKTVNCQRCHTSTQDYFVLIHPNLFATSKEDCALTDHYCADCWPNVWAKVGLPHGVPYDPNLRVVLNACACPTCASLAVDGV